VNYLDQAEKALGYLADSEADYAALKAQHQALKERMKIVEHQGILDSSEKSAAMKKSASMASKNYMDAVTDWEIVVESYELISAKRKRAELTIEMYRSVNSALKRGNI
jgi:hypothetical protein